MVNYHTLDTDAVGTALVTDLISHLRNKPKIALFLSGGSVIKLYNLLIPFLEARPLGTLVVGLVDERYFPSPEVTDSNFWQIDNKSNLFRALREKKVGIIPMLHGHDISEEAALYESRLEEVFRNQFYKVAILGIGTDGHTAGIMPLDTPSDFDRHFLRENLVAGYESPGQFKRRLTLTYKALKSMDLLYLYAVGKEKQTILKKFRRSQEDAVAASFPAVWLKKCPNLEVFTDQDLEFT